MRIVELRNDLTRVALAPDIGGRVISFEAYGHEWLWRNPRLLDDRLEPVVPLAELPHPDSFATWANFGGDKTWPAPQGWSGPTEWAGPPDPVLDAGRYQLTAGDDPLQATMTSGIDPVTGLRVVRHVRLDPAHSRLWVTSTLVNYADHPARWSVWEVTQLATPPAGTAGDAAVLVDVGQGGGGHVVQLLEIDPLDYTVTDGSTVRIPLQAKVGKIGFPTCRGRLALRLPGVGTFSQTFAVDPAATYPDAGSRAELWTQYPTAGPLARFPDLRPDADLVELECLSPLTDLGPGDSATLTVEWAAEP